MADAVLRASGAPFSVSVFPTKVPRERIITLRIAADHCPQALLRILGLIAQHDIVPLSIGAERGDDGQHILVGIDTLSEPTMAVLCAKIEAIVTVRRVEIATGKVILGQ